MSKTSRRKVVSALTLGGVALASATLAGAGGSTPYDMVGIPDGLGAFTDGAGKVTFVSNQELGATVGVVRAHGQKGAFVSKYTLDPVTNDVTNGSDLMTNMDWSGGVPSAFGRFCSADLSGIPQLYNASNGNGYNGKIYFTGEESGAEGRAVGVDVLTGNAKVLNSLGHMSFENSLGRNAVRKSRFD